MSRGHGRLQRLLLEQLGCLPPGKIMFQLAGATRAHIVALLLTAVGV